jgi:hypothetical protein
MDADAVLVHAPRVFLRRTSESLILLGTGAVPDVLHGTGIAIWDAFATPARVSDVTAALAIVYAADPAAVANEATPVIDALVASGLLTRVDP